MTRTAAMNVVHESETQRQHVRVRVPGVLEISTSQGAQKFRLHDLSGGGLGFDTNGVRFQAGQICTGHIHMTLETVTIAVPVRLQIRFFDAVSGRAGASFDKLDTTEVATLRRVVTSYLAGELIGAGEVIHTLSRNNFTTSRAVAGKPQKRGLLSRFRALAQTTLMLVLGLAALIYVVQRADEKLFGANSTAARVTGPSFQVAMPRDGTFRSLVPPDGIVKKGAPIGSFETSMFGLVSGQALDANLSPEQIDALLDRQIKGTVTSPCDCRVVSMYAADEQYVGKGQRLADLAPLEFEPYVLARFGYQDAGRLVPGTPVSLHINGDALPRAGHVAQLRQGGDLDAVGNDVVVMIKPDERLPVELVSRPAEVSARTQPWAETPKLAEMVGGRAEARP